MNEFTKEELEILFEYLDYPVLEISETEGNRLQLATKIQSMIDSKCHHEKDYLSDFTVVYPCKHCGELFR